MLSVPLALTLAACTGDDDTEAVLPPAETAIEDDDTDVTTFPIDTGLDTDGNDEEPEHRVTLHQWGTWELTPLGGPYDTLTGTLRFREYVDDARPDTDAPSDTDEPLACDVTFQMVGTPAATPCDGCESTWTIGFQLTDGNPGGCHDPYLPEDGATERFGYRPASDWIVRDYGLIGLWLEWWPADRVGDRVVFEWESTVGIAIDDEEEE